MSSYDLIWKLIELLLKNKDQKSVSEDEERG